MSIEALTGFGALVADRTRAELLSAMLDGRAYTGGELARHARVSPSTASAHLTKLRDAGLVAVEAQGRHRYFRLANRDVADLLETVASAPVTRPVPPRPSLSRGPGARAGLAYARSCYDHLAGELAVRVYEQLVTDALLVEHADHVELTASGRAFFTDLNGAAANSWSIDQSARTGRPLARGCLDWTERRRHLAGQAGASMLTSLLHRQWIVPGPHPRSIRVTKTGHTEIPRAFGLADMTATRGR